jgi:gentisate 1,2-dioxygenase
MNALDANFYAVHPDLQQKTNQPTDSSVRLYGAGFVQPSYLRKSWTKAYSPLLKFDWAPTYEALANAARVSDGSPYDGIIMEYVNPITGGPVMQTIGASMQLLRPGERTKAHRHTGSFVYQVAKGHGYSVIDGKRFDWQERDIFVVPSWSIHEHTNLSEREDSCLFSFNDLPVMNALGTYAEQEYLENGGRQDVVGHG